MIVNRHYNDKAVYVIFRPSSHPGSLSEIKKEKLYSSPSLFKVRYIYYVLVIVH